MIEYTSQQVSDSVTVVDVIGPLNDLNRKYFFDCIGEMIEAGSRYIIIDCHRIGHLNSSALAALLKARKQAVKSGGRVYLTRVSSGIAEVLEITKLGRLLSVFPSIEAALESIRAEPGCVG